MDNKPIGIFDSGAGGLTVAKEIMELLPNEDIIYLGDTARFPYGPRRPEELKLFVFEIINFLRVKEVKIIVVACNSSSATAMEAAQKHFDTPIIGVIEPGARGAVLATRNRKIGVIGTKATIDSEAYLKAIRTFDAGVEIYTQACLPFADLVERGQTEGEIVKKEVEKYLKPLISAQVDTLILGCTHYPLLSKVIQEVVGEKVTLISSARETAEEVKVTLKRKDILRNNKNYPGHRFISTNSNHKFQELSKRFLGSEIKEVENAILSSN